MEEGNITQSLKPIIENLENLFEKFNKHFFESSLSKPIITVSPNTFQNRNNSGWCTDWKAWKKYGEHGKNDGFYEINFCAEHLSRVFEDICSTMLHDMVHLYNYENHIKDTSRSNSYHNKLFKTSAEKHGLQCLFSGEYGWNDTTPAPKTLEYFKTLDNYNFDIYRVPQKKENLKQSGRKYVCPECGVIVRATREIRIICQDCNQQFELSI